MIPRLMEAVFDKVPGNIGDLSKDEDSRLEASFIEVGGSSLAVCVSLLGDQEGAG